MKKLIFPLLLLIVSEVSAQKVIKAEKVTDHSTHVIGSNFEGVIFSKDYKSKWLEFKKQTGRIYATDNSQQKDENTDRFNSFTPTEGEIVSAETLLRSDLKQLNRKFPSLSFVRGPNTYRHLGHYKRQYFGFITQKNEKVIMMNCFWDKRENLGNDWLENYFKVFDGGNYFWTIKINLTTRQLFDFGVNGAI